jgi:peptide/nickel transport system permease protein
MGVTVLKNVLRAIAVLLLVTFVTFLMMYGNAAGIARSVLGLQAAEADIQQKVVELGLDQPLVVQYWNWLTAAVTGDLGRSFYTGQSVTDALSTRVPVTLSVTVLTLLLTVILSVILGVIAAVRGRGTDRSVQVVSVLGAAVPAFIVAIVLVFTFAIAWQLLPATGYVPAGESVLGWLESVTLPVIALLVGAVAGAAAQFRTAVLDTFGKDFVRTLRARGISERNVVWRHVLRNSAGPGMIALSLTMIALLGGAVFIEQVFALPGMGQLAVTSAKISDVPMVMGTLLVTVIIVLVVNFLADLAIYFLNPKARAR